MRLHTSKMQLVVSTRTSPLLPMLRQLVPKPCPSILPRLNLPRVRSTQLCNRCRAQLPYCFLARGESDGTRWCRHFAAETLQPGYDELDRVRSTFGLSNSI